MIGLGTENDNENVILDVAGVPFSDAFTVQAYGAPEIQYRRQKYGMNDALFAIGWPKLLLHAILDCVNVRIDDDATIRQLVITPAPVLWIRHPSGMQERDVLGGQYGVLC